MSTALMVLPLIAVEHVGHWFDGGQWVGNCSVCKGVGHVRQGLVACDPCFNRGRLALPRSYG